MSFYNDKDTKICVMCGYKKQQGITIHTGFICDDCEQEIVNTDVKDEKYPFFIQRMKELWVKNA